jgi:hypothetical protein
MSNFMEIRPVGAKLFRANGLDGLDEANGFSQICESVLNQFLSSVLRLAYIQKVGKEAESTYKSL